MIALRVVHVMRLSLVMLTVLPSVPMTLLLSPLQKLHQFIRGANDEHLGDVSIFDLAHSMLADRALKGVHALVTPYAHIREVLVI